MKYLLNFFDEHQPRRIRVIENTLTNRRTVSNLFWAQQYGILNWTGADRSLDRDEFESQLNDLAEQGWLKIDSNQAQLTSLGVLEQEALREHTYHPSFYSWYWLGNVNKIEERLLLAVQVVSELTHHHSRYIPISASSYQLQWIRNWLYRELTRNRQLAHSLLEELLVVGDALDSKDDRAANLFAYMFAGFRSPGWTLADAADVLNTETIETQFIKTDVMLAVAAFAGNSHGVLHRLLTDLLKETPLTSSVTRTMQMFRQGLDFYTIARSRHLKTNTIREHLLTAAIVTPQSYPWLTLIPQPVQDRLNKQYGGKLPSEWQFNGDPGNGTEFFYFRLFQIVKGDHHER